MIYRIYDLLHHPVIAWRTLKNCIITGTLKDYWSWFETAIISEQKSATTDSVGCEELVDNSELSW